MVAGYQGVDTWIFDLDRTLYTGPFKWERRAFENFFQYVETHYGVSKEKAAELDKVFSQRSFYLKGWLEELPQFDIQHWWDQIDQVDASDVPVCTLTQKRLHDLPGNKVLFTNGHHLRGRSFRYMLWLSLLVHTLTRVGTCRGVFLLPSL